MQFLISELRTQRYIQKDEQFESLPFLGSPPDQIEFKGPVKASVKAELIGSEVLLTGDVSTVVSCSCARCLTNFDKKVDGRFKQSIDAATNEIDVDYYIKEAVIIDLPLKALCQEKCLGLCPECGQNRNEKACTCAADKKNPVWDTLSQIKFPNQ